MLGFIASTGVAKEPKTEFQEHIQMAKALSKSLVVAPSETEEDPEDQEVIYHRNIAQ